MVKHDESYEVTVVHPRLKCVFILYSVSVLPCLHDQLADYDDGLDWYAVHNSLCSTLLDTKQIMYWCSTLSPQKSVIYIMFQPCVFGTFGLCDFLFSRIFLFSIQFHFKLRL